MEAKPQQLDDMRHRADLAMHAERHFDQAWLEEIERRAFAKYPPRKPAPPKDFDRITNSQRRGCERTCSVVLIRS